MTNLATEDIEDTEQVPAPTVPGWYAYVEKGETSPRDLNVMIFLLTRTGQWFVMADNGDSTACVWSYIEQALGVFDLHLIAPLSSSS